jgi:hypothetical protein
MSVSLTLTVAANAAAQFLGVLDSGEALSTQQVADALAAANNLLDSWTNAQTLSMQTLVEQQSKEIQVLVDKLSLLAIPLATVFTLSNGTYNPASFAGPSFVPGTLLQFPNATSPLSFPAGVARAFELALAIELAPQYDMMPSDALVKSATEAKSAAFPIPGQDEPPEKK